MTRFLRCLLCQQVQCGQFHNQPITCYCPGNAMIGKISPSGFGAGEWTGKIYYFLVSLHHRKWFHSSSMDTHFSLSVSFSLLSSKMNEAKLEQQLFFPWSYRQFMSGEVYTMRNPVELTLRYTAMVTFVPQVTREYSQSCLGLKCNLRPVQIHRNIW